MSKWLLAPGTIWVWACVVAAAFSIAGLGLAAAADSSTSWSAARAFKTHCAMCHGTDGSGTRVGKQLHAPNLQSKEVLGQSDESLAQIISKGKNNMPSFGDSFDAHQIHDLICHIRRLDKKVPGKK